MDIRASIFRMTASGTTPEQYLDFSAMSIGDDYPLYFTTGEDCGGGAYGDPNIGCFSLESGVTGHIPPSGSDLAGSWVCGDGETMRHRAYAHIAPHPDTGFADCFFTVMANASEPDGIRRLARFHSPVECTGVGLGPGDATDLGSDGVPGQSFFPLTDSGVWWINTHAVYGFDFWSEVSTVGGVHPLHYSYSANSAGSYSCFQERNFWEYQYAFTYDEVQVAGAGGNSAISGWVNPCSNINLMVSNESSELEYVPMKIKFKNNSDLPTFFAVSAGLGTEHPGTKGFGCTAPDGAGASGNKGEYDSDSAFMEKFTSEGATMFVHGADVYTEPSIYPHVSGFVPTGGISTEYLIDSSFDYLTVHVLRANSFIQGTAEWIPGLMVQDVWFISPETIQPSLFDFWTKFPASGQLNRASPFNGNSINDECFPYGKVPGARPMPVTTNMNTASTSGPHHPRFHELPATIDKSQNVLITYSEPKTKIDVLGGGIQSAIIPTVGDSTLNPHAIAAPPHTNIDFGPYSGNHFLFDLTGGVACVERGYFDATTQQWQYNYTYMSPFHNSSDTFDPTAHMYGGFNITKVGGIDPMPAPGAFGGNSESFTFWDGVTEQVPNANGLISYWNPHGQTDPQRVLFDFQNSDSVDVSGWGDSVAQPGRIRLSKANDSSTFAVYQLDEPTYSVGHTWPQLEAACKNGGTVTMKYSFMLAGNTAETSQSATTVTLEDQVDSQGNAGHVTHAQFVAEIGEALNEWKELFEDVFPGLTLNFQNLGDEAGTSVPSDPSVANYTLPHNDNIGDLRFGMHNIDGASNVLGHAYYPDGNGTIGSVGNVGGDTHYDSSEDWRLDSASDANAFSIKYVTVHELGHVLGIKHDSSTDSVMYATAASSLVFDALYPNGLKSSLKEREAVEALYGPPTNNWGYQKRSVTLIDKGGSFSDGDSVGLSYAASINIENDRNNWVTRGGRIDEDWQANNSYPSESWESGFNMAASGWESPPPATQWPSAGGFYTGFQRSLIGAIQSVHDIRDAEPSDVGGYNLFESGPYLRESLFEMAIQSGNSIAGYIEGLQTTQLWCTYDQANPSPPNDPLILYQNMFESEPIVIDVYRVDKELTVTPY